MMPFNVGAAGSAVEFLKILELAADPAAKRKVLEEAIAARKELEDKQRAVEDATRAAAEAESRATAAIDNARASEAKAAREVERVQADRDGVLRELEAARRDLMMVKEESASLVVVRDATSVKLEELRAHTQALQEAYDSLKAEHDVLQAAQVAKIKEAEDLEKRLEKARTQIAKLLG